MNIKLLTSVKQLESSISTLRDEVMALQQSCNLGDGSAVNRFILLEIKNTLSSLSRAERYLEKVKKLDRMTDQQFIIYDSATDTAKTANFETAMKLLRRQAEGELKID